MRRRTFIGGLISSFLSLLHSTIVRAQVWALVTQQEFDRERQVFQNEKPATGHPSARAAQPEDRSAPKIEIKQPDPSKPLKAPVNIIITFNAASDAKIVLSSLRVLYGTFIKLDITDRIKKNAKLDEAGLRAEGVSLPAGTHNVSISIADDHRRVATRAVQFTVA